ncbi:hypothetical protein [Aliamphritea spongicola]|nr:hypothetical protein [Aliamphritea spongicola]
MTVAAPSAQLESELRAIGDTMISEWLEEAGASGQAVFDSYKAL